MGVIRTDISITTDQFDNVPLLTVHLYISHELNFHIGGIQSNLDRGDNYSFLS